MFHKYVPSFTESNGSTILLRQRVEFSPPLVQSSASETKAVHLKYHINKAIYERL
jgi:hypothetical protein